MTEQHGWRNWGDHPLVVIIAMLGTIFGFVAFYIDHRGKTSQIVDSPSGASVAPSSTVAPTKASAATPIAPTIVRPPDQITPSPNRIRARINDPDNYTNIRSGPGMGYEVVAKVLGEESFYVILPQGDWWQIETSEGKIGFMHRSRIRIIR